MSFHAMRRCRAGLVALAIGLAGIATARAELPYIVLQSTTSTQSSGLFDDLLPRFTAAHGVEVRVVAVGTGQALKNAHNGDGDVVLVHAAAAEQQFVAAGDGVERLPLMYNEFVIVGPRADPAMAAAFGRIAHTRAPFASRGDDSGTYMRERELWQAAGYAPGSARDDWYKDTGSGMLPTLNVALELGGYTLIDRATWLTVLDHRQHRIVLERDPALQNQYSLILVNPRTHPQVRAAEAKVFVDWMVSSEGQTAIADFRPQGRQLFFPNARHPPSAATASTPD